MLDQTPITTNAGVIIPRIIYGTAWKKERTTDLVIQAIQTGFTGIDTACQPKHYSEQLVGVALQKLENSGIKRESLYLQTKFTPLDGQDPEQIPYEKTASIDVQVAQSFETSKNNLQTNYIDTLILHSPYANHALTMQAWRAMENIFETGGAQQLGISNCYDYQVFQALYADAKVKPSILQNRLYKETGYDIDLRKFCNDHGIIFQSFWTLTANPHILGDKILKSLAKQYQKTEAQIFFRYLTQNDIVPLSGTCSQLHMQQDLDLFNFLLSDKELKEIDPLLV